jgi:Spy/CpxP family protein refolding chaperone
MAKVVNLNKFRKQKAKVEKEQRAETNRRLHGRTKAERLLELKQKQQLDKKLDGARLSSPGDDGVPRKE